MLLGVEKLKYYLIITYQETNYSWTSLQIENSPESLKRKKEELAKEIAKGPGLGLKDMMLKELSRIQDKNQQQTQKPQVKPETLTSIDLRGDK